VQIPDVPEKRPSSDTVTFHDDRLGNGGEKNEVKDYSANQFSRRATQGKRLGGRRRGKSGKANLPGATVGAGGEGTAECVLDLKVRFHLTFRPKKGGAKGNRTTLIHSDAIQGGEWGKSKKLRREEAQARRTHSSSVALNKTKGERRGKKGKKFQASVRIRDGVGDSLPGEGGGGT